MSRAGLSEDQFGKMLADLPRYPGVKLTGIWSHLASAGDQVAFAYEQVARLEAAVEQHRALIGPDVIIHTGATFAACRDRRFHKNMVRLGIGLYGHGPDLLTDPAGPVLPAAGELLPVVRWVARLIHVQRYPRGTSVGYSCTHHLLRDSVLGVVPVGHADGYPQALSNKGVVRLPEFIGASGPNGAFAPVLGTVSMDQIIIDLTDLTAAGEIKSGALVELISSDPASPISLPKIAAAANSSVYETLCRLSPRVARRYVNVEISSSTRFTRGALDPIHLRADTAD